MSIPETTTCPTPSKQSYRSQAEAKRAERERRSRGNMNHLYPYECPVGDHWHLTHHAPDRQLAVFNHDNGSAGLTPVSHAFEDHNVRHVFTDEPVFIGRDVCEAVGISKYRDALAQLDPDERVSVVVDTLGGPQGMTAVTESGIYSLMFISRSDKVKPFKRWLTHEVLPSIRKTGRYDTTIALPDRKTLAQWVIAAETRAELAEEERDVAQAQVAVLEPKAEFYDELMDADGTYSFLKVAKMLGWGRNVMMRELRRAGVLQSNNLPYRRYEHHFKVTPQTFTNRKTGETVPTATTSVWPSGIDFLRKKLAVVEVGVTS